jgi:hypothetical protein
MQQQQQQQQQPSNADWIRFELSSPKLFHVLFTSSTTKLQLDIGAGSLQRRFSLNVPTPVQTVLKKSYSTVSPYVEWAYGKLVAQKVEKK